MSPQRRRPPRLQSFDYRGQHRYFVTCCTSARQHIFLTDDSVRPLMPEILQCCALRQFALLAYVFMPDHLHLLVEGTDAAADFRSFMRYMRRRTAIVYRDGTRGELWQDGYFERVLRRDEDTRTVIRYTLANPVRAGLVENAIDYPFSWAIDWDVD